MTIDPISNLEPGLSVREKLNALISLSVTLETDVAQSLINDASLLNDILAETSAREAADLVLEGLINDLEATIGTVYYTRAEAIAATIPVDVKRILVFHDDTWLEYKQDATGTALATNPTDVMGVITYPLKWSPSGTPTVRHWGAVSGASMAADGTVTGTDCTAQAQGMIDWVKSFTPTGASRGAVPRAEWGSGYFRVSGALDFTGFSTNARMMKFEGYGATILADGAGSRVFDLTDAQYIELAGFTILGSKNFMPVCAVKTGRKGNNDGAAYVTLRDIRTRGGTNEASVRSYFSVAALWQVASETSREENCIWENFHNGTAAYGAAYDNINALGYTEPQIIASFTATNPAVFTIVGHGFVDNDVVVATVRSSPILINAGSQQFLEGKALVVNATGLDTFELTYNGTPVDGTTLTLATDTALCKEVIAPSTFITTSRLEPFKRHSQLHNVRHGNTYFNHEGKAAVFQGVCEGVTFDQCFIVGRIGFHLKYTQQRSTNDLHWAQCTFGDHLEGGGTIGTVDDWMLVEPATVDAGTVARFNKCKFFDNTMQAFYVINQGAGVTPRFVDCEFSIARNATSFIQFAKTPADVYILGGSVGLGDIADFNVPSTNHTCDLVDYALETVDYEPERVITTEDFDAVDKSRFYRNVTASPTGAPFASVNWHLINIDRNKAAGVAEQIVTKGGVLVTRTRGAGVLGPYRQPNTKFATISGDATTNITWTTTGQVVFDTATLTADRIRRLINTGIPTDAVIRVTRTGSGAFNCVVWDGTVGILKNLAVNQWADFIYDGTNWRLSAFGSL